jgi:hypothetical protein
MPTLYEELKAKAEQGEKSLREYESRCLHIAAQVTTYIQKALGWPADGTFKRVAEISSYPDGARPLPGGWLDNKGRYTFLLQIDVGRGWLRIPVLLYREASEWHVQYGGEKASPIVVTMVQLSQDFQISTPINGLLELVASDLRETLNKQLFETRWA